jgi:hypothetical protein
MTRVVVTGGSGKAGRAADTVMRRPNRDLMAAVFPDVPLRDGVGESETLLSIAKARRLPGYAPAYSWRTLV